MNIDLETTIRLEIEARLQNLQIPLGQFGEIWKTELTAKQFQGETDANGSPWKPLSPGYREWKIRKGYPTAIGRATQETFKTRGYITQKDGIRLGYQTPQAKFFDKDRPLFSKDGTLPGGYLEALSGTIVSYLNS
jgi:hypothetical protein